LEPSLELVARNVGAPIFPSPGKNRATPFKGSEIAELALSMRARTFLFTLTGSFFRGPFGPEPSTFISKTLSFAFAPPDIGKKKVFVEVFFESPSHFFKFPLLFYPFPLP
jgi:hypothetical protein